MWQVSVLSPIVNDPSKNQHLVSLFMLIFIFLKNVSVAMLILLLSFRVSVLFPSLVLAVNGAVIGAVCANLAVSGIPWQEITLYFVPHGIIEIPTMIGVCVIATSTKETKEKLRKGGKWIVPLLGIAAIVETYVTPLF